MLFGQSLFQSVVERLSAEAEAAARATEPSPLHDGLFRHDSLGAGFVAENAASPVHEAIAGYGAVLSDGEEAARLAAAAAASKAPAEPEPEPQPPAHLLRDAPEEVEADLAIAADDTIERLGEKRRSFARLNHPDAVAPQFRPLAHRRMTIANLLIDAAIRAREAR